MEREALAALEKHVASMRVLAAEKAVLARSLSYGDPPRFHAEVSTALLALAVFVMFMVGREAGIFVAKGEPCPGVRDGQYAYVAFNSGNYDVIVDTNGDVWKNQRWEKRVAPAAVREVANQLARGCFLEAQPPYTFSAEGTWSMISLRVGKRFARYRYMTNGSPLTLCGGRDDIRQVEQAIRNVADH